MLPIVIVRSCLKVEEILIQGQICHPPYSTPYFLCSLLRSFPLLVPSGVNEVWRAWLAGTEITWGSWVHEVHCFLEFLWQLLCFLSALAEDELEPARKKRREQLTYLESEEFQKILKAKSKHTGLLKEVRAQKVRNDRDALQMPGTLSWD